jgi:hypothetical protein
VPFTIGAAAQPVSNMTDLASWMSISAHGWSQSRTALRAITGIARMVWDFGGDTVLMKRCLFGDPYNPVSVSTVLASLGWKMVVFYVGLAAMLVCLWRRAPADTRASGGDQPVGEYRRGLLLVFAAAALPALIFAIAIFEPSSPERFMPLIPFAGLGLAASIEGTRQHVFASACVLALLVSSTAFNLAKTGAIGETRLAQAKERFRALDQSVQPGALVFVLTFNDDVMNFPAIRPLDRAFSTSNFRVADTVEIASSRMQHWRAEFCERTLEQWTTHHEVWITSRLLALRPEAAWRWVEGDDPRIKWADLPAAFSRLEVDRKVLEGNDGFVRVAESQANRDCLNRGLVDCPVLPPN